MEPIIQTSTPDQENKTDSLRDFVQAAIEALYSFQQLNEQKMTQCLSALVRNKSITADESFKLQDQFAQTDYFEKALDRRIEAILKQRGLIDEYTIQLVHESESGKLHRHV